MNEQHDKKEKSAKFMLWSGRMMSILLFLFWGDFFIEHLSSFFTNGEKPPFLIYLVMAFHLCLILSYLISLWNYLIGSMGIVLFAFLFFLFSSGKMFLPFFLISVTPAVFYLYYWKNIKAIKKYSEQENKNE